MRRSTRLSVITLTTVSAGLLLAAPAQAATTGVASAGASTVLFKAAKGTANKVVVTRSGNTITIDDKVAVKAGKGCKKVKGDKTKVKCRTSKAPTKVTVYTYDKADSIRNNTNVPTHADGGTGNDFVAGGSANDTLHGWTGSDRIYGGGGEDHIWGWTGANTIYGGDAKDTIQGGTGVDRIYGGAGRDEIFGAEGNDHLDGGADRDWLIGEDGNDSLWGGDGDDYVDGRWGNDYVSGGNGADELRGDDGSDRVYGGPGYDWIYTDATNGNAKGADYYAGGSGRDSVMYRSYAEAVTADPDGVKGDDGARGEGDTIATDVESIWGGDGNDRLSGGTGDNSLLGGPGNDTLQGGAGDDYVFGAEGADQLFGDAGDDFLDGGDEDGAVDHLDGGANDTTDPGDSCELWTGDTFTNCEVVTEA
jgi:Ca2+-binding RTX toxin-like protein